jgi:hypothetical protein
VEKARRLSVTPFTDNRGARLEPCKFLSIAVKPPGSHARSRQGMEQG